MAKLGDKGKAAVVRVATSERAQEIYRVCEDNGWKVVIGIEPDKEEDTYKSRHDEPRIVLCG